MSQPKAFVVHAPSMILLGDLNPAAYNPRKISPEKYEALKQSIKTEGFVESIVVQKSGLRIIGGHQRVRAAKELCIEAGASLPQVPCIVLDVDDVRAKKLNIKLNNLKGEFEARMLGELLIDIYDAPTIEMDEALDLGFGSAEEAQKLMHLIEPPEVDLRPSEPPTFGKSVTLSLEFGSVEERDRVKKILMERAEVEKKKTGAIIANLLLPKRKVVPIAKSNGKKNQARA